ncbi:UNVERIFIED_CONTAM: hypothetical protein FKN15_047148 [Acipenser sinensis]
MGCNIWTVESLCCFVGTGWFYKVENGDVYQRRKGPLTSPVEDQGLSPNSRDLPERARSSWHRIVLLILAITIHNIPEHSTVPTTCQANGKFVIGTVGFHSQCMLQKRDYFVYGKNKSQVPVTHLIVQTAFNDVHTEERHQDVKISLTMTSDHQDVKAKKIYSIEETLLLKKPYVALDRLPLWRG